MLKHHLLRSAYIFNEYRYKITCRNKIVACRNKINATKLCGSHVDQSNLGKVNTNRSVPPSCEFLVRTRAHTRLLEGSDEKGC